MQLKVVFASLIAVLCVGTVTASAQTPPRAAQTGGPAVPAQGTPAQTAPQGTATGGTAVTPPVSADPTMTTAAFGDWLLRCVRTGESGREKLCEVLQSITVEGQSAPFAQIAIGRLQPKDPLRATVVLPHNVTLATPAQVQAGEADTPLGLTWQRCLPGGCFADAILVDDVRTRWRAATRAGSISFADGAGRRIGLPISFRGLSQALDALATN
jgi:invasion protein IalB